MKKLIFVLLTLVSVSLHANDSGASAVGLSTAEGNYVFGQINRSDRDQFMLEVKTGRLWQLVFSDDGKKRELKPIFYIDAKGENKTTTPFNID